MSRPSLSLAALVTLACGSSGSSDLLRIEIDTAGRYPVIRSIGEAPNWTAELTASIGGLDDGPGELSSARSVLLDRDGSVWVVDSRGRSILAFDSTGAFVRQIGREGAGPGEYRSPYSIAMVGDTLALLDPGNARIGLFDRSGTWVGAWILGRAITGGEHIRLYRTLPDGFWAFDLRPGVRGLRSVLIHFGTTGAGDTIDYPRAASDLAPNATCNLPGGGMYFHAAPFSPALLVVPTPARERAVAITSEYRIAFLSPGGDTVRVIERQRHPVPITDDEWSDATESWRTFRRDRPEARCDRADFPRPAVKPPLAFLFVDTDGRLWVEVTAVDGPVWDVFDPGSGRLIFTVPGLPSASRVDPSVDGARAAFVVRDTLDLPHVRLYRLVPPVTQPDNRP